MADPTGTLNARPGDSTNMLLQKILLNLADLPGTFIPASGGTMTGNLHIGTDVDPFATSGPSRLLVGRSGGNNAISLAVYGSAVSNSFRGYFAGGTEAAPTATPSGATIMNFAGSGYDGTQWIESTKVAIIFGANQTWTTTAMGTNIGFYTTRDGTTTLVQHGRFSHAGALELGVSAKTQNAWTTNGSLLVVRNTTITDASSSGTVAAQVASAFLAPTFAASAATTFTDAANLYIAGDVAAGTNVTLTNSYGLWNVGKTRLDGLVGIGVAPQANISLTIAATVTPSVATVYGLYGATTGAATATTAIYQFYTNPRTSAAAYTLDLLCHYRAAFPSKGAGSSITTQEGFTAGPSLTGATNNYGFRGMLASASNTYNLYMDGTAPNYLKGALTVDGVVAIGNTVAAGVGVASTHKVTISIGGNTYYLLASNV